MIPVTQRFKHDPDNGVWGDCHRAVIASLLELPIDEVPHFCDQGKKISGPDTDDRQWLRSRGLTPINMAFPGTTTLDDVLTTVENCNPGLLFILGGTSRNGTGHSVVAGRGEILHDPSIDQSGIVGPMEDGLWWVTFLGAAITSP